MADELFLAGFTDADDLNQEFDSFGAEDSLFTDDEPAPAFAPWAVGDFAAPAPAMDVSFGVPAPAPAATNACKWSGCSDLTAMASSASSSQAGPATDLSKRVKSMPVKVEQKRAPAAAAVGNSKVTLVTALANKAERKATSCMEATEARERELRQQLRSVEQSHAILREYSNLLRKLLASAQVKVSSTTNPFNVVGGRPKRLFRCAKGEVGHGDEAESEETECDEASAPERLQQQHVRAATGKAAGSAEMAASSSRPAKRRLPCAFDDHEGVGSDSDPASPNSSSHTDDAAVDMDHGALLGLGLDDCYGLGELVLPASCDINSGSNCSWFDMPAHKAARYGDGEKLRADSFSLQNVSPFLALASAEASW